MKTPVLPESAPFSVEQRMWLNGFLAGVSNYTGSAASGPASGLGSPAAPPVTPALPVLVLYGSQSGTSEGLAQALAGKLQAAGGARLEPRVVGMDKFKDVAWASESRILMLTSTWGDGDMPDNAVAFWDWLKGPEAPSMAHVKFAVLGLGDRNYARFCQAGRNLDGRFAELGATRLLPFCECNTDYEAKSEQWMGEARSALDALPEAGNAGVTSGGSASNGASAAGNAVDGATPAPGGVAAGNGTAVPGPVSVPSFANGHAKPADKSAAYNRKNPFPAALLENHPLNAKGSGKDTRHISLSLLGSGLEYRVGDALGIYPRNCYELVDRIILALNCLGNEKVTLDGGEEAVLRAALISKLDLRRGSERILHALRDACRNPGERRRLNELLSENGAPAKDYLADHDVLDVLEDFPHTRLDAAQLTGALSKIAPRLYSISSSPKENPGEVHLTVGVVRYASGDRLRRGVASTFLAERVPLGMTVPAFVQPAAHFGLPSESGKPIIMVGPGTGVAPFRAFLQERRCLGDTGRNWLFFGDQRRRFDFLYSEEVVAMQAAGFLTRLDLAFSRDQEEKVYVQDRMLEKSRELYAWLEEGAHFYVCGDAKRMAKDVEEALLKVIAKEGGKSSEDARAYLDNMKAAKRYQRDVY